MFNKRKKNNSIKGIWLLSSCNMS